MRLISLLNKIRFNMSLPLRFTKTQRERHTQGKPLILIKIPQNLHDYCKFKRLILGCQNRVMFT